MMGWFVPLQRSGGFVELGGGQDCGGGGEMKGMKDTL